MKYIALSLFFFAFSEISYAQNNNGKENDEYKNSQVRFNLNPAFELEIDSPGDLPFNFETANEIEYGITKERFARFKIKATQPWTLTVKTQTPYFSASGRYASSDMPASVLKIRKSHTNTYIPLSYSAVTLFNGARGGSFTSGNDFHADINFTPGFDYSEGYYSITLVYTLSAM
jgi:hypothetical protein